MRPARARLSRLPTKTAGPAMGVPVGCLGLVMHSRGDDIKAVAHAVSAKKPPHDGKDRERLAFQLEP